MAKSKGPGDVYQLKITLKDVKPPVWRRVLVEDCTLDTLHGIIQRSMGWDGYHMHDFDVGGVHYGEPDPDGMMDSEDESKLKLSRVVGAGLKKFTYTYDFGDGWRHVIQIEKALSAEPGVRYPRCVAGKRACPPEDCGGPWGYAELLEVVQNPKHPEHAERLEWAGGELDPEAFDVDAVNKALGHGG